jgi:hypothetical protein
MSRIRNKRFGITSIFIVFLLATFPGKGGMEGHQRDIQDFSERNDYYGFFVPLMAEFPDIYGHWRYSLVVIQILVFWSGFFMLIQSQLKTKSKLIWAFILLVLVGSVFVSQMYRDSFILSFLTFGLGLLHQSLKSSFFWRISLMITSIIILFLTVMFRPLYGFIVGLLVLWLLSQKIEVSRKLLVFGLVTVLVFAITPYIFNKKLSELSGLKKSYPQQAVIQMDLASNYCWGRSDNIRLDAAIGIKMILKSDFPIESICASLDPHRWDNLYSSNSNSWRYSAPLILFSGDESEESMTELEWQWFRMIIHNPIDWLQVRSVYLGPVLLMSNSFVPQSFKEIESNLPPSISKVNFGLWTLFFTPVIFLDKIRATSPLFAFILLTFLFFFYNRKHSNESKLSLSRNSQNVLISLIILLALIIVTAIGYVSANGRYVLPYIFLIYLLLICSEDSTTKRFRLKNH